MVIHVYSAGLLISVDVSSGLLVDGLEVIDDELQTGLSLLVIRH